MVLIPSIDPAGGAGSGSGNGLEFINSSHKYIVENVWAGWNDGDGSFVVIEGNRQDWVPRPVSVKSWQVAIFDEAPLRGTKPILANAFAVENVAYHWKRGRIVRPGGAA